MSYVHTDNMDKFFEAVMSLKNIEECYEFFEDLCTIRELKDFEQRFTVARMLADKCVYNEIAQKTGASTATISRVNRALMYGSDGYKKVLERMNNDN